MTRFYFYYHLVISMRAMIIMGCRWSLIANSTLDSTNSTIDLKTLCDSSYFLTYLRVYLLPSLASFTRFCISLLSIMELYLIHLLH